MEVFVGWVIFGLICLGVNFFQSGSREMKEEMMPLKRGEIDISDRMVSFTI